MPRMLEAQGQFRMALGINLYHDSLAGHVFGCLRNLGSGHAAWSAPRRPEIRQHRNRRSRTISSNSAVSTFNGSSTGGSGDLHLPQRAGVRARCFAGTRFFVPQLLQVRIMDSRFSLFALRSSPELPCGAMDRIGQIAFTTFIPYLCTVRCEEPLSSFV